MKRKVLSSISILIATVFIGYAFLLGGILGVIAGKLGGGKKEGQRGLVASIIIPIGGWKLHLHHWVCSIGLIIASFYSGFHLLNPHITYGFLGGLAFQGVYCYSDWYRVIMRRQPAIAMDEV